MSLPSPLPGPPPPSQQPPLAPPTVSGAALIAYSLLRVAGLAFWTPVAVALAALRVRVRDHASNSDENIAAAGSASISPKIYLDGVEDARDISEMLAAIWGSSSSGSRHVLWRGVGLDFLQIMLREASEPALTALLESLLLSSAAEASSPMFLIPTFGGLVAAVIAGTVVDGVLLAPLEHARIRATMAPVDEQQAGGSVTTSSRVRGFLRTRSCEGAGTCALVAAFLSHVTRHGLPFLASWLFDIDALRAPILCASIELLAAAVRDILVLPLLTIRARLVVGTVATANAKTANSLSPIPVMRNPWLHLSPTGAEDLVAPGILSDSPAPSPRVGHIMNTPTARTPKIQSSAAEKSDSTTQTAEALVPLPLEPYAGIKDCFRRTLVRPSAAGGHTVMGLDLGVGLGALYHQFYILQSAHLLSFTLKLSIELTRRLGDL